VLAELQIRDFAIIDELSVSFGPGFTVVTGETGAGKSILVNAINLLLGSRGSAELVRGGRQEATVAALFGLSGRADSSGLSELVGSGAGAELLVKRIVAAAGRNRVYLNGELATVGAMSGVCRALVSISGQHEHQLFLEPEAQLEIIDWFGGLDKRRDVYAETFATLKQKEAELRRLRRLARERREKEELRRFQLDEITAARVQPDEEVQLAEERERLRHVDRLQQGAVSAHQSLYANSGAVLEQVSQCQKRLADLARLDEALKPLSQTLEGIRHQVEDVSLALRDYSRRVQADPVRLQWVEERLDTVNRLLRKYGGSTRAMLAQADRLEQELQAGESDEMHIAAEEEVLEHIRRQALAEALELSECRQDAAASLGRAVEASLASLDMPYCRFTVCFAQEQAGDPDGVQVDEYVLHRSGLDRIGFYFSANPDEEPKPMAKIASGGELSRVLLALKELLAREGAQETLVFDEVDAGIGGRTAEMVGRRLRGLSRRHQVICITHLPQIACYGDQHYAVRKSSRAGRTFVKLKELTGEQRVEEIARMLGGAKISASTRAHAREMLEQAMGHTR
jgi:DNA repair protein RecN (Recombination protein N)